MLGILYPSEISPKQNLLFHLISKSKFFDWWPETRRESRQVRRRKGVPLDSKGTGGRVRELWEIDKEESWRRDGEHFIDVESGRLMERGAILGMDKRMDCTKSEGVPGQSLSFS